MKIVAVLSGVLFSASLSCTKHINGCDSNADCTDPAYPFCDVNGAYPPSDGTKNICTITPPGCPADVCGCAPGAATCGSGELTTCDADGSSTTTTSCALGCGSDAISCASFTPSNGLGPILAEASAEPDVSIPSGTTIDTDAGTIVTANGQSLMIASSLVTQTGALQIRALAAKSFTIADVTVIGASPIAFVAATDITINGNLDVSAVGVIGGAGAVTTGTCVGNVANRVDCSLNHAPGVPCSDGGGGGGNAVAGGDGGSNYLVEMSTFGVNGPGDNDGGAVESIGFSPLAGGCAGGSNGDVSLTPPLLGSGGGGGGAVQLVAGATIELVGTVNANGGGGSFSQSYFTGGGAGGNIVIETPTLTLTAGGFSTNGGGGGGCGLDGYDGTSEGPGSGGDDGTCAGSDYSLAGGTGGTIMLATSQPMSPGNGGFDNRAPVTAAENFGGGGGSVGRVRITTRDGTYSAAATSLQTAVITTATLVTQ